MSRYWKWIISGLVLLPVLACAGPILYRGVMPSNITHDDYRQALAQWQAAGIQDYEMAGERVCLCSVGSFTLRVVDGQVDLTHSLAGRTPAEQSGSSILPELQELTVAGQFAYIDQQLNPGSPAYDGQSYLSVTFDPHLGYPVSVVASLRWPIPAFDHGSSYTVTRLTVLKANNP
jgi:hypothetical protein